MTPSLTSSELQKPACDLPEAITSPSDSARTLSLVNLIKVFGVYLFAAGLSVLIFALLTKLWKVDLTMPFFYRGDNLSAGMFFKGVMDNGWYRHNPYLGAPSGLDMTDYPVGESLHFLTVKILSLFFSDWVVVLNIYLMLTYVLTTLSALYVFRRFHFSFGPCLLGSILYAFLPYHFIRSDGHVFLAAYYMIPPLVLLVLEILLPAVCLAPAPGGSSTQTTSLARVKALPVLLFCVLIGTADIYYAVFGCFFLMVAGLVGAYQQRTLGPVIRSALLTAFIGVVAFANLAPNIAERWTHGANPEAMVRQAFHSETLGLKPAQLLLPVSGHRLSLLCAFKDRYNLAFAPLVHENDSSTLGLIGSAGFLFVMARLVFHRGGRSAGNLLNALGTLCLAGLLLSTMGGFGTLFAFVVTAKLRAFNRVSIYIAFFSLLAIVFLTQRLHDSLGRWRFGQSLVVAVCGLALVFGVWDQSTRYFFRRPPGVGHEFRSDRAFVRAIEACLPDGAMIFQLPYAPFPEHFPVLGMSDYDHFRGYLHSKALRWSYGGMRGRETDLWQRGIAALAPESFLEAIVQKGFEGLYLDRNAYPDRAASMEAQFSCLLHAQPLVSANGRLVFFDLRQFSATRPASSYR